MGRNEVPINIMHEIPIESNLIPLREKHSNPSRRVHKPALLG
jgi:hypothetical protein